MRRRASRALVVLIAFILFAPCGLAADKSPTSAETDGVERATAKLAALDEDLDGLRKDIESARGRVPAPPPGILEELDRARPRVREAVSLVLGLHWRTVEPVLAAAKATERKIADLEDRVRPWPTEASRPVAPAASPSASGTITGVVTDEATGTPLANVRVYVSGPSSADATSDATGHWMATSLQTGTYHAYTSSVPVGYVAEMFNNISCISSCWWYTGTAIAVTDGAVTSGVNFALAKVGSISGTVTDLTSGLGIAGVRVRLSYGSNYYMLETLTGADGSYSFPQVPAGTYFLNTVHVAYFDQLYDGIPCEGSCDVSTGTPVVVVPSANTPGIDFALQLGGSVSGKLTLAATGAPISGGYVRLSDATGFVTYGQVDSTGSYQVVGLKAGTYFATTDTYAYANQLYDGFLCEPTCVATTGTPIVVSLGEEKPNVDFSLETFGAIQGKVIDAATGFPLADVSLRTYASDGTLVSYDYTDQYGDYVFGGLLTKTYFVVASSPTHLDELYNNFPCELSCDPTTGTPVPVTLGSVSASIDFALGLGGGVQGRVTAAVSGTPLGSVQVEVFGSSGVLAGSAYTNAQGDFVVADLPSGSYFARAVRTSTHMGQLYNGLPCDPSCTVTGGTPIPVTGGVATSGVNFVLTSLGAISGTVTAADTGQPLSSVYVTVYDATGTYVGYGWTDSAGAFKVKGLVAGDYFARVTLWGYAPQLYNGILCADPCTVTGGTPIPVALSTEIGGVNFSLVALGKLTGTITDAPSGLPLPYRNVAVHDATGTLVTYASSDATGAYAVSNLPAGRYYVSTTLSADYVDELWDNRDCGPSCDVTKGTPVDVTLGTVRAGVDFRLHLPYFADVSLGHWARRSIEGVFVGGVTSGCGTSPLLFCPDTTVSRWQMAAFLARSLAGSDANVPVAGTVPGVGDYDCVAGGVSLFPNDVPPTDGGCRHIHYIYRADVTSGCGPGSFCPGAEMTRWQAAIFLARALAGSDALVPAAGTVAGVGDYNCVAGGVSLFPNDVPPTDGGCRHIHYIYGRGVTAGCGPGAFCPSATLSRAQMAVFLANGFNFSQYGF